MPFQKGQIAWNKGLIGIQKHTDETKRKIGLNGFHYRMLGKVAWNKNKKGLQVAWNKGISCREQTKEKISLANRGKIRTDETRKKISIANKGKKPWSFGKHLSIEYKSNIGKAHKGENHWRWISDRSLLKKDANKMNDCAYKEWVKKVKDRDNWKCRINNKDCNGRLEAHHILGWKSHPELRYEINNGISLCQFHHPRKRVEEQKLIPVFQFMNLEEVNTN